MSAPIAEHTWVYAEADEGDYDFDENEMTWEAAVEGEEDYYYEEEEDEAVVAPVPAVILKKDSNVSDAVFLDDESLMNCWKAALSDYKFLHPAAFGPITEAPRSMVKKLEMAPLWYAPAPSYDNGVKSETSTSDPKKRKQNNSKKSIATTSSSSKKQKFNPPVEMIPTQSTSTSTPTLQSPIPSPHSPTYTPQSPDVDRYTSLQEDPSVLEQQLRFERKEGEIAARTNSKNNIAYAGPQLPASYTPTASTSAVTLPSPSFFQPPSNPSSSSANILPSRDYPEPPGMIEPPEGFGLIETSPEEKLQNALWSWYEAGYNTALYHTALGALEKEKREKNDWKRK